MVMLYREELIILYGGNPKENNKNSNKDDLSHDDFFERNYKSRNGVRV